MHPWSKKCASGAMHLYKISNRHRNIAATKWTRIDDISAGDSWTRGTDDARIPTACVVFRPSSKALCVQEGMVLRDTGAVPLESTFICTVGCMTDRCWSEPVAFSPDGKLLTSGIIRQDGQTLG